MKKLVSVTIVFLVLLSLFAACGQSSASGTASGSAKSDSPTSVQPSEATGGEVVLNLWGKPGEDVAAIFFNAQVERFNEKYAGQYRIELEVVPYDTWFEKLQQLATLGELPPVVFSASEKVWLTNVVIKNKLYYDLSGWLEEHPEIREMCIDEYVDVNTLEDGSVVTVPLSRIAPQGLFYNHTMYSPDKPIHKMSMEEFEASLGENKIAFQTADNAWTTSLLFTACVVAEPGGTEELNSHFLDPVLDFNTPIWINAVTSLQRFLQTHASDNAVGATYPDAANSFMSGNSAIICNGPWMIGDFVADTDGKWSNGFTGEDVSADFYPGNFAVMTLAERGAWVSSGHSEEVTKAALEYLAFIYSPEEQELQVVAEGGIMPKHEYSAETAQLIAQNRLVDEYVHSFDADTKIVTRATDAMPESVGNVDFPNLLPKLIDGSMTPEEFCKALTEKAQATIG